MGRSFHAAKRWLCFIFHFFCHFYIRRRFLVGPTSLSLSLPLQRMAPTLALRLRSCVCVCVFARFLRRELVWIVHAATRQHLPLEERSTTNPQSSWNENTTNKMMTDVHQKFM